MSSEENTIILESILHSQTGPYLFVGAGLSRRYGGLPDWRGLLREFAVLTKHSIEYYISKANGDLAAAAHYIAEEFFDIWWESKDFSDSVKQYQNSVVSRHIPLKIEVSKHISETLENNTISTPLQQEFEAFSQIQIDAIVTTNYDDLLSRVFPDFRVFVGQDELIFANPQGVAEIYQIHGSVKSPETLILTDSDYEDFNRRNAYLAAKLITVFMEHPVIFMGYSLSDPNVTQILQSILHGVRPENADRLRSRLIFVEWSQGSSATISETVVRIDDVSLPITRITTDSFTWIYKVLANRRRALPARVLRQLKEQVYDLVQTDDPRRQLMYVTDLDNQPDASDIDIVFGVGARIQKKGIVGLSRWDLVDDLLNDPKLDLDALLVLRDAIPRMGRTTYVPIFKYLRASEMLEKLRAGKCSDLPEDVLKRYEQYRNSFESLEVRHPLRTVEQLLGEYDDKWIMNNVMKLPAYTRDVCGLRELLIGNRAWREQSWWSTQYGKLAVVYDWMHYNEAYS